MNNKPSLSFIRRSRGYVPDPIPLHEDGPDVLGCGADIKNTFTLAKGSFAIPSQHRGDMENYETLMFFEESLRNLKDVYRVKPEALAYDLHPGYLSTQWALKQEGIKKIGIQHHYAHIASVMAENGIKEKVIGVSFDGTGYGKAAAQHLLRAGASVGVVDLNQEDVDAACAELAASIPAGSGARVVGFACDVSDADAVDTLFRKVKQTFDRMDILVNNAGSTRDNLLIRMKKEEWDAVLSVNLTGAYRLCRAVVPAMVRARFGRIVNVSWVIARLGNAGQANYAAAKAGIVAFTKTLAIELGRYGVTANAVAPGFIDTEMTRVIPEVLAACATRTSPTGPLREDMWTDFKETAINVLHHKRKGGPEDRGDLTGEHPYGDAGQFVLACLFIGTWVADTFFFEYTTFFNGYLPLSMRIPGAVVTLFLSGYLAKTGLFIVFGEKREKPAVIREGVLGVVRHPIYLRNPVLSRASDT